MFASTPQKISATRLIVRSDPLPHENVQGWLLRLAGLNGLAGIKAIFALAGINERKSSIPGSEFAARLALITDVDCHTIEERLPPVTIDRRTFYGGISTCPVTSFAYLGPRSQVCPACLEERNSVPAVWELKFWVACPIHKCRMLRACSDCGEPIRWSRSHVNRCGSNHCNFPFSQGQVTPAHSEVIALVRWLAAIINQSHRNGSKLYRVFGDIDLSEALRMISLFGKFRAPENSASEAPLDDWSIVESAAAVLSDWPGGFHRLLDRTPGQLQGQETRGLTEYPFFEAFGRVQGRSASQRLSTSGPIIKAELLSYIEQREENSAKTEWRLRRHADREMKDWATADEAAKLLNMHNAAIHQLVKQGTLEGRIQKGGSYTYLFVSRRSLEDFAETSNRSDRLGDFKSQTGAITAAEVAEYLGISLRLVEQLGEAKLLSKLSRFPMEYYTSSGATGLLNIFSRALATRRKGKASPHQLCHPWLKRGRSYLALPDLVEAVSLGYIAPIREEPSQRGFLRFLFDSSEVSNYLGTHKISSSVGVTQAQEMLRCGWGDIPRLVEAGLLTEGAKGILLESIEKFNNNYACLSVLAEEYQVQATALSQLLKARRREPILSSSGPSQRMFWRRSDVAAETKSILALQTGGATVEVRRSGK
jgi:hypothetical protein